MANLVRVILPVFVLAGALFCFRSGVVVSKLPGLASEPDPIILFYIVSLFTFGAKDFGAPIAGPWVLQGFMWVFYFLAPLITMVAMADILSIVRPLFIWFILNFRPYYLVLGYGRIGKSALEAIQSKAGRKNYVIILDKDVDDSVNDFSVIFEHVLTLRSKITPDGDWRKYISGQCRGVFVLTDQELLNLRIYHELKSRLSEVQLQEITGFTRIRSKDIIHALTRQDGNGGIYEPRNNCNWAHHRFINVHEEAPHLLFNGFQGLGINDSVRSIGDEVLAHYRREVDKFSAMMSGNFDTVVLVGFGTFSSSVLVHLKEEGKITSETKLIIVDPLASRNWISFLSSFPEFKGFDPTLSADDFSVILEHDALSDPDRKYLCFYGTNDEEQNVYYASYFSRKMKFNPNIHAVIRTKYMEVVQDDLLDSLLGYKRWVIVPTYTWIKLSFEKMIKGQ
jgi:hypothetical protein